MRRFRFMEDNARIRCSYGPKRMGPSFPQTMREFGSCHAVDSQCSYNSFTTSTVTLCAQLLSNRWQSPDGWHRKPRRQECGEGTTEEQLCYTMTNRLSAHSWVRRSATYQPGRRHDHAQAPRSAVLPTSHTFAATSGRELRSCGDGTR